MELEFIGDLGGWAQRRKDEVHRQVVRTVHNVLRRYRREIELYPVVAKYVSVNDKVLGISQNNKPFTVSFDNDQAEIRVRPFYADAKHPKVLAALRQSGGTTGLYREGLHVGPKGASEHEKQFQSFASAPRLLEWAQKNGEYRRSAVLISDQRTLEILWAPLRDRILDEINREISHLILY